MRVAHVSLDGNLPRYGIGTAVVRLTEALARRGHEVLLLVRRANAEACPAIPGVRIVPLDHRGGPLGGRRSWVRQVRRALGPGADVVHVHGLTRMAAWLLPRRRRGDARLVVTAHSAEELGASGSASGRAAPRRARRHVAQAGAVLRGADEVLAPSRFVAERIRRACGRAPRVVPWGPTDPVAAPRLPHEGFEVLFLGRLVPAQGADVLIDAFARAFAGDAGARLVVAGEGPDLDALRRRARERGVGASVAFAGYLDDASRRAALARADVLAVPTLGDYETFCLAALDGAAAGAALLVADGGALPERADGCGLVVAAGDVGAWSAALRGMRDDPARTASLGAAGRRVAEASTWVASARAHEAAYRGEAASQA